MWDSKGNKYIDALAGLWCTALGAVLTLPFGILLMTDYFCMNAQCFIVEFDCMPHLIFNSWCNIMLPFYANKNLIKMLTCLCYGALTVL